MCGVVWNIASGTLKGSFCPNSQDLWEKAKVCERSQRTQSFLETQMLCKRPQSFKKKNSFIPSQLFPPPCPFRGSITQRWPFLFSYLFFFRCPFLFTLDLVAIAKRFSQFSLQAFSLGTLLLIPCVKKKEPQIQVGSIQFKFICIALFTIHIVSKQLYRKCITETYMEKYI